MGWILCPIVWLQHASGLFLQTFSAPFYYVQCLVCQSWPQGCTVLATPVFCSLILELLCELSSDLLVVLFVHTFNERRVVAFYIIGEGRKDIVDVLVFTLPPLQGETNFACSSFFYYCFVRCQFHVRSA